MASSVFYRFKSSKEPSRVTFDGTGISVFELKREIITQSGLGNGLDFELTITSNDTNDEYQDDTEIIPRSTTVIAKRLPAARPGKGGAARYLSGKPPVNAKNSQRKENAGTRPGANTEAANFASNINISDLPEDQRMAAVLKMGEEQWKRQQQSMANMNPVHRSGPRTRPANVPDHPPPAFYTCHRCDKKGHWLQECPENGNPAFDDVRRIKRTMGIPRSQLKVVEKTSAKATDGTVEEPPPGVMIDASGNWVVAEPDKVAWNRYQEKANKSAAAQEDAARGSKELQERGLECSIDKRLFIEPTKTPCCKMTYCKECITNALLDDGLQCPNCGKDGVPIDDLEQDEDMAVKIRSYENEKATTTETEEQKEVEATQGDPNDSTKGSKSPQHQQENTQSSSTVTHGETSSGGQKADDVDGISSGKADDPKSNKRKADSKLESSRQKSPALKSNTDTSATKGANQSKEPPKGPKLPPELAFMNQLPNMGANPAGFMNGFMGMPMGMNPMMDMNPAMWNQMMMSAGQMGNQWNSQNGMNSQTNMMPNQVNQGFGRGGYGRGVNPASRGRMNRNGNQPVQQRAGFKPPNQNNQNAEESAYFRQPVNPNRHGKRNVPRPTDYREI